MLKNGETGLPLRETQRDEKKRIYHSAGSKWLAFINCSGYTIIKISLLHNDTIGSYWSLITQISGISLKVAQ